MPHPWEISRGKPQTIQSLVEEEHAFHRSRIQRGELDAALATAEVEVLADSLAAQATIALPDIDLDGWTATMAQDSDAARVTYAIPFRGAQQIVRLAVDWKTGGHAVAVVPGEIQFSIWSRDKDAAAIRAEADLVLLAIGQQWRDATTLVASWNAVARDELLGDFSERHRLNVARDALLENLNQHDTVGPNVGPGPPPARSEL